MSLFGIGSGKPRLALEDELNRRDIKAFRKSHRLCSGRASSASGARDRRFDHLPSHTKYFKHVCNGQVLGDISATDSLRNQLWSSG